jgi:tetraprenyl-beta-curcumene synthase
VRVVAKETAAALAALSAYVVTVRPGARRELGQWRKLAEAIPDSERQRKALASLEEKRSNVGAVAVFATLTPLRQRHAVLRAIVLLQLAIDYRDTLEERGMMKAPRETSF